MHQGCQYILVLLLYCNTISSQISTFSNPVLDTATGDVTILKSNGHYYLVSADNPANELQILKSPYLSDFRNVEKGVVYKRPSSYTIFHPASFLEHENGIYLYFHMISQSLLWQTFVVKADDFANPMGTWSVPVRVINSGINHASQGAPFQINRQLYFVWQGPPNVNSKSGFYIAKMKNPTETLEPVVLLREPVEDWECTLSGPSFLYNRETVYLIHTSCTENSTTGTSLSSLSIKIGLDPLIPSNWEEVTGSVFQGNQEENVYKIRYSEFTTSPDGTETWMMYIASSNISNPDPSSSVRIEKIDWNKTDGSPIFPLAKANGYQQQLPSGEPSKFYNPVNGFLASLPTNAYRVGDTYYTVSTTNQGKDLTVLKSDSLNDYSAAEQAIVYTPTDGSPLGAGPILEISGDAYLYFYSSPSDQIYWLYVLRAANKSNLMENWGTPTRLIEGLLDGQGFHPTVLQLNNQNYFIWAHSNNVSYNAIYIAPMGSPTEIVEPVVLLKEAQESWECFDLCMNYYPSILYHKNHAFMVFSASSFNHAGASFSYMSIENGKDPLDVINWYTAPGPVFARNDAENVYAPYAASFTTSPDGLEDWMMYIASENSSYIGGSRSMRIQKIGWEEEYGKPVFPKAHGLSFPHSIPSSLKYFSNPITDDSSVSPGVIRVGDFYYMLLSTDGGYKLEILKSGKLVDFRNPDRKVVFSVPDGFSIFGSSKLQKINEQLYIYFSMQTNNSPTKMFVMRAHDPFNPMGVWDTNPIPLAPSWDFSAFHSTVLKHGENLYLVWVSPHPATAFNSIFIAQMKNATYLMEPFNLIRHPMELWECEGVCSNEAPFFLYNNETSYLVHSVGSACSGGNALTYMSIGKDKDPLDTVSWIKAPDKIFTENRDENVLCPAHATFTVSPDGKETWMVYHATDSLHPDAIKTARIEKINWDEESGNPVFPEAHGFYHEQLAPAQN